MIEFQYIKWKNFLSTGNAYTELNLKDAKSTLILGKNGSGKSTFMDAICFALFGKPYRNINKPQLVNSVNEKQCSVEVGFTIGKTSYKVVRGIKPTVFEIWVNDVLINQESSSRDYQRYLEDVILKLNFKSFTQIVIVGTASFVPFMELPAAARREIIEDLLDIKIFTAMNTVLKNKLSEIQSDLTQIDNDIDKAKTKSIAQERLIKTLTQTELNRVARLNDRIEELALEEQDVSHQLNDAKEQLASLEAEYAKYNPTELSKIHRTRDITISKLQEQKRSIQTRNSFYQTTPTCPKCNQEISESLRLKTNEETEQQLRNILEQLQIEEAQYDQESKTIVEVQVLQSKIQSTERVIYNLELKLSTLQEQKNRTLKELETSETDIRSIDEEKERLKIIAKEGRALEQKRAEYFETKRHHEMVGLMLKDSGIKTRIVKKYLPIINKIVNQYLAAMDLFVQFTVDEKFNENVKSRYRDDFTYASFSEGEKQRISLALLFTWRDIARLKNTANTNLLVLDEVFDSSLDQNATEQLLELITALDEKTNVFVISHRSDQLASKFDRTIKFEKRQNFSRIV